MTKLFEYWTNFYIQGATEAFHFVQKHYEYFNKPDSDISDKIGYCKLEKTNDEYTTSANVFLPSKTSRSAKCK